MPIIGHEPKRHLSKSDSSHKFKNARLYDNVDHFNFFYLQAISFLVSRSYGAVLEAASVTVHVVS